MITGILTSGVPHTYRRGDTWFQ